MAALIPTPPALVEEQPRRLLAALAAGVLVVATRACGLDDPEVITIDPLDTAGLVADLRQVACLPAS